MTGVRAPEEARGGLKLPSVAQIESAPAATNRRHLAPPPIGAVWGTTLRKCIVSILQCMSKWIMWGFGGCGW